MNRLIATALLAAMSACLPRQAHAEIQNCTNITSLPAVISSQGVYCLKQDLSTSITSGSAIQITTNNVTLDCNGFKLGGLGAGPSTQAIGVMSPGRSNITVRNCNVRGFRFGVSLGFDGSVESRPSGNLVENNRIERSTFSGIYVAGDSSLIRNNLVFSTGLSAHAYPLNGIVTQMSVDIIDNTIDGVTQSPGAFASVHGINTWNNNGGTIAGNRIRGLQSISNMFGIFNGPMSRNMIIQGNVISLPWTTRSYPVYCEEYRNLAAGNTALGVHRVIVGCVDDGRNVYNMAFAPN